MQRAVWHKISQASGISECRRRLESALQQLEWQTCMKHIKALGRRFCL